MDDIREIVRAVVEEFMPQKTELEEERKRREGLEQRVSELIVKTEEAERSATVRAELQRQGVTKLDLAYKAIKDEIKRGEDGRLIGTREHVEQFVKENPELLPARVTGGSGAGGGQRSAPGDTRVELEKIRPGMNPEELDRVRQEIARVASLTLRGWYFPNDGLGTNFSGMPFYDAWNLATFAAEYGHPMATITLNTVDPTAYPDEVAYLPTVIGNFTTAIMSFVYGTQPTCRFEVLYPTDVNQTAFNRAINYPMAAWTPAALTCLKTEAFGFTFGRNLDMSWATLDFGTALGFTAAHRSHLVGVGDSTTAWLKEARGATGKRFESVVLFAIDQFCLIGYDVPLPGGLKRSFRMGQ